MEISYKKRDNRELFSSLEKLNSVQHLQNYIPLYNVFFSLNNSNYNNINLNHKFALKQVNSMETYNKYEGNLLNVSNEKLSNDIDVKIFFKYSPLLDPIKYLIGKYDMSNTNLLNLPNFENNTLSHPKVRDPNNSAYVDSFFTYLTSQLLHEHDFLHGLDFYGSYLGIKKDFEINVIDDIDYMYELPFFNKNNGNLFTLAVSPNNENMDTRNFKKRLEFKDEILVLELSDISDLKQLDTIFSVGANEMGANKMGANKMGANEMGANEMGANEMGTNEMGTNENNELVIEYANIIQSSIKKSIVTRNSESTCSSRSSNTDIEEDSEEEAEEEAEEEEEEDAEEDAQEEEHAEEDLNDDSSDEEEEDTLIAKIATFPVQVIALEMCEGTLDSLILENDFSDDEWGSVVMQILMMLITFQNKFNLTHNDLHTNNIMYKSTEKEYLYYKFDGVYYKVPTYGRLYKIIDFGRAIYKFRGQVLCSDSFHRKGDAATQYNCEPYFNNKKPRIEPNYSFDLCRLGCALYDLLVEEDEDVKKIKSPIIRIITDWCKDDKGKNIMYKNNGEERYPDFKLYKMIARNVHNHVPAKVLTNPYFDKFIINKKKMKKDQKVMNIDIIPDYSKTNN
jgi:hypothetical protein